MLCFEVIINDEVVCTAGVGDYGLLNAAVQWVQNRPGEIQNKDEDHHDSDPHLYVGGMADYTHVRWLNGYVPLKLGDTVSIKIVERENPDEPTHIQRNTDPEVAKNHKLKLCA